MKYGYFDEANFEYVIERPDTPKSWTNYIGTREFGGVITNNAGGYSFYKTSGQGRFTRLPFNAVPNDQPGRYFYIRDNESGDFWSTSWQPVGKPLDQYKSECRFAPGYAVMSADYSDIHTETTYYIPIDQTVECWNMKVTNTGKKKRKLGVYSYVEFTSEWHIFMDHFNLQYSMYVLRNEFKNGFIQNVMCGNLAEDEKNFKNRDQSRWWWMTLLGSKVTGYDLDRETFIGGYRTYKNPVAVETGKCQNSTAYGDNGCGGLQTEIELAPGETRELMVLMGVGHADKDGKKAAAKFGLKTTAAELQKIKEYWKKRTSTLKVNTPDKEMNVMLNQWGAYDALVNFYWCRSASLIYSGDERDGFGYRDTVQDCTGNAALIPDEVRERLELMLTGQESNGGAMPEVKPFAHYPGSMPKVDPAHQRSDDMLWHFYSIDAYVRETGDIKFYNKVLPYCDKGKDTVLGHLRKALEFNLARSGRNGLPCGLYADWDDCIRMGFKGETTFVAFQMRYGFAKYAEVAKLLKKPKEAAWAEKELKKLDTKIQKLTWDGNWFIRGFNEKNEILGSAKNKETKIFQPIQSWAIISGAATEEQGKKALASMEKHLETPFGYMALMPPAVNSPCKELRMTLMNPGQKENAGIFSHSQGWIIMANALMGFGDRAYRAYRNNLPARFNEIAELRQVEPYCYCQSTSSRYSKREGKSHLPWLTGSAGWSYYAPAEFILGIRPELDGLRIDPCIPKEWNGFTATRVFRGKTVSIEVKNPSGKNKGVKSLVLNGKVIEGNLIPLASLKRENTVVCEIA